MDHDTGPGESLEIYEEFIVQLRKAGLRFQKQCVTPMGELTLLLTIQNMCERDSRITVSGLGEKLGLSRPAVSRMIHVLKRKGFIEFFQGKEDHRYLYLTLTEEGKELIREEMNRCMSLIHDVSERMGKDDMEKFLYYSSRFFSYLAGETAKDRNGAKTADGR